MQIVFTRTHSIVRPFADFGTLFFRLVLLIPFPPFTHFKKKLLIQCFYVEFQSEEDCLVKLKAGKIPVGAVWDISKFGNYRKGPDGRSLVVMTPKGEWFIDGRSYTCTRKDDNDHRCWVRHGSPETGDFCVDKKGNTCESGAGSIRIVEREDNKSIYHARLMKNTLIEIPFF